MTDSQSPPDSAARQRKRQLVAHARALFVADGYAGTSVSAIVRAAGVAQGTFYLYFKKKEEVLAHLRGQLLRGYLDALRAALATDAPADRRLVDGMLAIHGVMVQNVALIRVFRQASTGEETEQIGLQGRATLAEPLAELIAAGAQSGVFTSEDARLSAHFVLALFDDLLYQALAYQRPATTEAALHHGAAFMLRALGVDAGRIAELSSHAAAVGARAAAASASPQE